MIATNEATAGQAGTYTIEQLAQLLNCSLRHVRRLDAEGTIPGRMTFGRLVRFSRRQVDAWLNGETGQTRLAVRR
ncbi:MAG: excisionase family DNA-binding protein [Gemmatales bacterium]